MNLRKNLDTTLFAGGENGSSLFRSEAPGNNYLSSDASPGTRNSDEESEETGRPARLPER
jgi:hypothetical protein